MGWCRDIDRLVFADVQGGIVNSSLWFAVSAGSRRQAVIYQIDTEEARARMQKSLNN
jgi:hypothetical protein